jgi:hypothetical protein
MHGFGAMCLLRSSRCVLSTSVRGLEMPVDEYPSCARGACPFLCPWSAVCCCLLHMYHKSVLQYCRYKKRADTNERTTNEIPFDRKDSYYRGRTATFTS